MNPADRGFFVADFDARGDRLATARYDYRSLEQVAGAIELITQFSTAIYRSPESFEHVLAAGASPLSFRWLASSASSGIASLRAGEQLLSISILACGKDSQADAITLEAFHRHLLRELHDTGIEPSFALKDVHERPVIATINLFSPATPAEQRIAALSDRCFAASYFRFQNLA